MAVTNMVLVAILVHILLRGGSITYTWNLKAFVHFLASHPFSNINSVYMNMNIFIYKIHCPSLSFFSSGVFCA
ncbi:hypothetical protein JHK82_052976 [Glycine max]|uniref:Uncharacterized protein n=2 Tax=Glycine subgen. Soja TaxID=1462606 RepID=K7MX97_SOYBN|nr:hypothetical protein JHK86_052820 [Glycine max]KAG4915349.1 hypothetical protein JHK87_052906 [Glycine soja]KAG4927192.1 hypothetical protein JHK85_053678 [Glycine max]KAG5082811.1 hypothetical protein JHK84_052849 [Glycine max]KAG5085579.1 hypothetical protein JHK82_052976 [Glycine max]